jgi:pimeloyl-ACP methyl ester carboxylesterase
MKEDTILFGNHRSLVGVLTRPARGRLEVRLGVVLLNAGIVHRVGPGRVYVKIARELAARGFTVLRFDFSGIGDSLVRHDPVPFHESAVEEAQAAMDVLQTEKGISRFLLLGGCSGARVSLDTASLDARVYGAILINFPGEDDGNPKPDSAMRKDSHYFLNFAIRDPQSWGRFVGGKTNYRKLGRTLLFQIRRQLSLPAKAPPEWFAFRESLKSLLARGFHPVFVCSAGDSRLEDLRRMGGRDLKRMCLDGKMELVVVPRSDHTFSSLFDQARLIHIIGEKAEQIEGSTSQHLPAVIPATVRVAST